MVLLSRRAAVDTPVEVWADLRRINTARCDLVRGTSDHSCDQDRNASIGAWRSHYRKSALGNRALLRGKKATTLILYESCYES